MKRPHGKIPLVQYMSVFQVFIISSLERELNGWLRKSMQCQQLLNLKDPRMSVFVLFVFYWQRLIVELQQPQDLLISIFITDIVWEQGGFSGPRAFACLLAS